MSEIKKKNEVKKKHIEDIRYNLFNVIRAPVVTEKTTGMSEKGKVVFNVEKTATKKTVKEAVEALFGVEVKKVNILNRKGKTKKYRGISGRRSDVKKAIVSFSGEANIDFSAGL